MKSQLPLEHWQIYEVVVADLLSCVFRSAHSLQVTVVRNHNFAVLTQVNVALHEIQSAIYCVLKCSSCVLCSFAAATSVSSI